MQEIYLTKMILNPESRAVWRDLGNVQQMHRTICGGFPKIENPPGLKEHEKRKPRGEYDLLHRVELRPGQRKIVLYVQSNRMPDWSHLPEGYLLRPPECKDVHERYATIREGFKLVFRLCANPTKRAGKNFELRDPSQREEFARKFRDEKKRRRLAIVSDDLRLKWLADKGSAAGFRIDEFTVKILAGDGTRQVPNLREAGQVKMAGWKKAEADGNTQKLTYGSVTFDGVLEVVDAGKFREALVKGIGTGKAYGFGLLSVAPIRAEM